MWDGAYKSKKQVSLRGKSNKQQDRNAFRLKVKTDREARAREKQLQTAATVLQARWRTIRCLRQNRLAMRSDWDRKLTDLDGVARLVGNTFVPPPAIVAALTRTLLEFFHIDAAQVRQDSSRFARLCPILSNSLKIPDPRQNYSILFEEHPHVWRRQVVQLTSILLAVPDILSGKNAVSASSQPARDLIELLITPPRSSPRNSLTSVSSSTTGPGAGADPLVLHTLCGARSIQSALRLHDEGVGILDALSRAVAAANADGVTTSAWLGWLSELVCVALDTVDSLDTMCSAITSGLLMSPFATRRVEIRNILVHSPARSSDALTSATQCQLPVLCGCLQSLVGNNNNNNKSASVPNDVVALTPIDAAVVLSNLVEIRASPTGSTNAATKEGTNFASILDEDQDAHLLYARVSLALLEQCPTNALGRAGPPPPQLWNSNTTTTTTGRGALASAGASASSKRRAIVINGSKTARQLPTGVVASLCGLAQPQFVRGVLVVCLNAGNAKTMSAQRYEALLAWCQFFSLISRRWTVAPIGSNPNSKSSAASAKLSLLSPSETVSYAIAFSNHTEPLLSWLWSIVLVREQMDKWLVSPAALQQCGAAGLVSLACSGATSLIPALDDEELFERGLLVPKAAFRAMTHFLRDVLYLSVWLAGPSGPSERGGGGSEVDQDMLLSAIEMYGQLYERYQRRPYMPAEEWLFNGISPGELGLRNGGVAIEIGADGTDILNAGNDDGDVSDSDDDDDMDVDRDASGGAAVGGGGPRNVVGVGLGAGLNLAGTSERGRLVLRYLSQAVSFEHRLQLFLALLAQDEALPYHSRAGITVQRKSLYEDAYDGLAKASPETLLSRVQVSFVNEQGLPEAGIDGGGIFKEFICEFAKQAFDPTNGLWKETEDGKLYPNPRSGELVDNHLSHFAFIGRMLAMSVHEGVLVEPELAEFFLNSVLGKVNHIHDLQSLDPEIYRNLMALKQVPDPADLCLTFSLTDDNGAEVELMQRGSDIAVTKDNFVLYIARVAHHKLNVQLRRQSEAFRRGFNDLIDSRWMQMFQPRELQNLIGGTDHGYAVSDLMTHSTYGGGYHLSQPYMESFWRVVDSFSTKERAQLLSFVTSCPRPPLRGFQALKPPFTVYQVRISDDSERLPTASTCVNLLKLPTYSSEEVLRAKLLFAITSEAGFEFS